jgi:mevalonate kinase
MLFKASAPGSLMLLGEYAVLQGFPALVCAVDKRITVTLEPRVDKYIVLKSSLGTLQTTITDIQVVKPFEFVLMTLKKYQHHFQQGCNITIEAEFSNTIGFASSAAVTVATLSALFKWLDFSCSLNDFVRYAREIVFAVQGMGSGADVAACVYGGLIAYQPEPLSVEKFLNAYPITVVYSGSKTATPEAVRLVKQVFANKPAEFLSIIQKIGACAKQGIQAVADRNWIELGKIMNQQQTQMEELGVNTPVLASIIAELRKTPISDVMHSTTLHPILGAKISGSGLGDCIVGLGREDRLFSFAKDAILIPVEITKQGVYCEKS